MPPGTRAAGDTTKTVDALQQMLRIAPTNQPLRDLVFKKLLAYGKPELAEDVASEGLKLDSGNPDLYDLRANARIFREDYNGALKDLEQIAILDSTKADSTYFVKYLVTATASSSPDTARILKASAQAARKFPDNMTLFKQVIGAYALVGQSDSLLVGLEKLAQTDPTSAVGFALSEAKTRQDAKDLAGADPFIALAAKYGDAAGKESAAAMMFQGIIPLLQGVNGAPPQWQLASDSLRVAASLAGPRVAPVINYYFGLASVNVIVGKDSEVAKGKSCDGAKALEPLVAETETALATGEPYVQSPSGASQAVAFGKLKEYITTEKARVASMVKAYCK